MATQERFYWQLLQICRCRQPVYTILQRGTCVNWLMDVCEEVGATRSTYYLAMYISDVVFSGEHAYQSHVMDGLPSVRHLSSRRSFSPSPPQVRQTPIQRSQMQLVYCACILIAVKFEEVRCSGRVRL